MPVDNDRGSWIQAHHPDGRGFRLYPFDPRPGEIRLLTAARSCCYLTRYSGNLLTGVRRPWHRLRPESDASQRYTLAHGRASAENTFGDHIYSVGQHQLLVSWILLCAAIDLVERASGMSVDEAVYRLSHARVGLGHDLPEGCGLVDVPYPVKIRLPEYIELDKTLWRAFRQYGLPSEVPSDVDYWDKRIVATERRDFIGPPAGPWRQDGQTPLPLRIWPMRPRAVYARWCARWHALTAADLAAQGVLAAPGLNPAERKQRILAAYKPPARRYAWNRARFAAGLRYMTDGRELPGVWQPDVV